MSDDRQTAGAPPGPVQWIRSFATLIQTAEGAPEWRWHMWQEQVCGQSRGPVAWNRMCPQRHPPEYVFALAIPPTPSPGLVGVR